MKKIKLFACLAIVLLFAGCAGMQKELVNPEVNIERTAGIGDEFFQYEFLTFPTESSHKFELTILELNPERLGLQYNEYFYSMPSTFSAAYAPSGWMVKQGFNKRFDYAIADKTVRFKNFEFEVLSVENGQIKYRRIK